MRVLLFICFLVMSLVGQAQSGNRIDSFKTKKGVELKTGDTLQLGRGTSFDGSFQYVRMGLLLISSTNDPLPTTHANTLAVIQGFRVLKVGQGSKVYALLKAGTFRLTYADIEPAIDAKEVIGINGQEFGKPGPRRQPLADNTLTASSRTTGSIPIEEGMTVKPFSNDVSIRILSITGNKSQQTVTVNFVLKTELPHQRIGLIENLCNGFSSGEGKAYDEDGTQYNMKETTLGSNAGVRGYGNVENKLPTSVPLKGSIVFSNVLPKMTALNFITFYMSSRNYEGRENCQGGNVEIRNAKIEWK